MDVMLDLETFGVNSDSAIVVIGALKFTRDLPHVDIDKMDSFYRKVDSASCEAIGMHIESATVSWWKKQAADIREEVFSGDRIPIKQALSEFSEWYKGGSYIWSQGANFDIPILSTAYRRCGMTEPWSYWSARDTRTLYDVTGLSKKDLPSEGAHNALKDCWRQVYGVKECVNRLRRGF
jgi:DNA polymerase III epsilon subunit-like protein